MLLATTSATINNQETRKFTDKAVMDIHPVLHHGYSFPLPSGNIAA
jgi:hypothetical protein